MEELLREVYYNPQTGFRSVDETLRQARALNNERQARAQRLRQPYVAVKVDREDVKRFLESQEVRQQTARRRREGSYVATAAREEFECDLAEFGEGFGGGARYALVCVDVFSKKCAAAPMVDKRPQTTAAALRQCFSELGVPVRIYTDEGSEFQNSTVEPMLASLNVALVTTRGYANFVERMIRTLKERLRIRHLTFGEPWDRLLPAVVKQYNDQAHAATRMAPKLAALDENNDLVRARLQKRAKPSRRPPLVVGDIVRIARPHTAGRRVRDVQFGAEAYPVQEIVYEGGVTRYRVNERLYLRHDLLKITDIRAPSGQSRILDEDDQPLVPRVSRAMQQQYNRNVNRRLALGRMTGDSINFVYARDEDDEPLSNLAAAPAAAPAASDDDAPLVRLVRPKAPPPSPDIFAPRSTPKAPPFREAPITGGSSSSRDPPASVSRRDVLDVEERERQPRPEQPPDRELMPPPKAPPISRRDVLDVEEAGRRPKPVPAGRPIGQTTPLSALARQQEMPGQRISDFTDEFYRRVAWINRRDRYVPPRTVQEKYTAVRDALRRLRPVRDVVGASLEEYRELEREYNRLFDLVSFDFPNPEQQRAEDLGLLER